MLVKIFMESMKEKLNDYAIEEMTKALREKMYVWIGKEKPIIKHIGTDIMWGPILGQESKIVWTVFWDKV
jgi:hypothetical protein